jgi:hypothetical protein
MQDTIPRLRTVGVIAQELDAPVSRVAYALRKLRVKPIGKAGIFNLYDAAAVETVRREVEGGRVQWQVSKSRC